METNGKIDDLLVFLGEMYDIAKEILRVLGHLNNEEKDCLVDKAFHR